jgi:hypothetical protein
MQMDVAIDNPLKPALMRTTFSGERLGTAIREREPSSAP